MGIPPILNVCRRRHGQPGAGHPDRRDRPAIGALGAPVGGAVPARRHPHHRCRCHRRGLLRLQRHQRLPPRLAAQRHDRRIPCNCTGPERRWNASPPSPPRTPSSSPFHMPSPGADRRGGPLPCTGPRTGSPRRLLLSRAVCCDGPGRSDPIAGAPGPPAVHHTHDAPESGSAHQFRPGLDLRLRLRLRLRRDPGSSARAGPGRGPAAGGTAAHRAPGTTRCHLGGPA